MAGLWPKLKNKLSGEEKKRKQKKKSKSKAAGNPYASEGLEKFAELVAEVQGKKTVVEKTGASLSAALSLSRSAQEWTANSVVRTANKHFESRESPKSPELVFAQCAVRPSSSYTTTLDVSGSFSFAEPGFEASVLEAKSLEVGNLSKGSENESEVNSSLWDVACEPKVEVLVVGDLQRDSVDLSEVRPPQENQSITSEAGCSTAIVCLPLTAGQCIRRVRNFQQTGWKQTSNSTFLILLALGAFISSQFVKVRNPLATALTFSLVMRTWGRGRLYLTFMFSLVARYLLTPFQSYLTVHGPSRLSILPSKLKMESDMKALLSTVNDEVSLKPIKTKVGFSHERNSSFAFPVYPVDSAPISPMGLGAPLSAVLPVSESCNPTVGRLTASNPSSSAMSCNITESVSPTRRLANKVTSKFKRLKLFRSSSSKRKKSASSTSPMFSEGSCSSHHAGSFFTVSEPGSPFSPSSALQSGASSPDSDRRRKCPFTRQQKAKSRTLSRMSSTESLEQGLQSMVTANVKTTTASPQPEKAKDGSRNVWPVMGLLVTLLFLLIGRLPAIVATSLFLVVVSNTQHDRSFHNRGHGRDTRTLEAARKLQRNSPPRGRRPGSPLRGEMR